VFNEFVYSFPREETQGAAFEERVRPVDLLILFECSDEVLTNRALSRGANSATKRSDDNETAVKDRIVRYRENIEKILVQYPEKLKRINGDRSREEIFDDVKIVIDEILAKINE
jgi:adenylate kinase